MNELVEAIMKDLDKFGAEALSYKYSFKRKVLSKVSIK